LTCVIKSNPRKISHAFMALSILKSIPSGTGGGVVVGDWGCLFGVGMGLLLSLSQSHAPQTAGYSLPPTTLHASLSVRPMFDMTQSIRDSHEYPSAKESKTCFVQGWQPHLLPLSGFGGATTGAIEGALVGGFVGATIAAIDGGLVGNLVGTTIGDLVGGLVGGFAGVGAVIAIGAIIGGADVGAMMQLSSEPGRHCE
jgi:hypothetical protein